MTEGAEGVSEATGGKAGSRWLERAVRLPVLLAGAVFLLFPHPGRALHEIRTLRDPNALVAPDDPAVAKLSGEIDAAMPAGLRRPQEVAWIQDFVDRRIVYVNDWDQWLNVDYWPPPSETLAAGREDCDGIALLTASVLNHRGFRARVEASYLHVWVVVRGDGFPAGGMRILHPDKETNFDGDHWSFPGVDLALSWFRYSLSEFPLWRWTTLVMWGFLVVRWPNRRRFALEGGATSILLLFAAGAARTMPDFLFGAVLLVCAGVVAATLFRRGTASLGSRTTVDAGPA